MAEVELHDHETDPQAAFIERTAAKYDAEDAAALRTEDGIEDDAADEAADEGEGQDGGDAAAAGTEEHPDAGTSADGSDGSAAESGTESTDDDEDGHTGDEPDPAEGGDATDAGDGETENEGTEEEDGVSDETKAALTARGADLTLEDVPEEHRAVVESIVTKKLRNIDAAFSRTQAEQTAFRAERTRLEADQRYRKENPELVVIEMLEADPTLYEKVNERWGKLEDPDQAAAFKIIVEKKKQGAVDAVAAELADFEKRDQRGLAVDEQARTLAAKAGVPFRYVEKAVIDALKEKPEDQRDLSDAELKAIVDTEAKEWKTHTRQVTRDASKEIVRSRTAARQATPPTRRAPASAAPVRPAAAAKVKVDHSSEESRHKAMMATAKRVIPGAK